MTRLVLALLLGASAAAAQSAADVREALNRGAPRDALQLAEAALTGAPADGVLLRLRAEARRGVARDLQRTRGYAAAVDYLEGDLGHPLLVTAYSAACAWAGQEERGLRGLGTAPPSKERADAQLYLLRLLRRYDEAAALAESWNWTEGAAFYRTRAEARRTLLARGDRAGRIAWIAAAVLLAASAVVFRLAPRSNGLA